MRPHQRRMLHKKRERPTLLLASVQTKNKPVRRDFRTNQRKTSLFLSGLYYIFLGFGPPSPRLSQSRKWAVECRTFFFVDPRDTCNTVHGMLFGSIVGFDYCSPSQEQLQINGYCYSTVGGSCTPFPPLCNAHGRTYRVSTFWLNSFWPVGLL